MKSLKRKENMEEIAIKFLSLNDNPMKFNHQDSISTLKDLEIFGKITATTMHSRTRSKVISIISNNKVLAEYDFDFFNNKKVLYKIPSKVIEDDVLWEEDIESKANEEEDDLVEESLNEEAHCINHENVYRLISGLYSPLLKTITSLDDFRNSMQSNIEKIDKWIVKGYHLTNLTQSKEDIYSQTAYEIIFIGYVVFFYQNTSNPEGEISSSIAKEDYEGMFQLLCECLEKLQENLILLTSYNSSNKPQSKIISYEELCLQYVKEHYRTNFKPAREQILSKLRDNLKEIKDSLGSITEMIINSIYQSVNSAQLCEFSADFMEDLNYFDKLLMILQKNQKASLEELKASVERQLKKLIGLLHKNEIPTPYLPPIDSRRYKYTLVLDLDETLVHYIEEEEKAFVQVRPHAEVFITELGKYFELVIFTAAAEDYANIVIKELDSSKLISHKLYRKHTLQRHGIYLKDLSKLGRNLKTTCIIDNNKENYSLQPDNGLPISSFTGDQKDNELLFLAQDLMKLQAKPLSDDIKPMLKVIRKAMLKRYAKGGI